ncbi:MAG: TRAP transporter large permease subunit [Alphaproteobacteria bacterium]
MEYLFLVTMTLILAGALASGFPAAFAIPGSAIVSIALAAMFGWLFAGDVDAYFVHTGGAATWLSAGVINIRGVFRSDETDILIAIPLFIFMGVLLQRSKIAEDLLLALTRLLGPMRGGLGISVVFVGTILAATTSVIGATVVAMGTIALPSMVRVGYSKPLAAGTVAATGTLGQIIPPSIVLIILNHQLTTAVYQANSARRALYTASTGEYSMPTELEVPFVSIGEMFLGAFIPGFLLVGLFLLYIGATAFFRPDFAPVPQIEETKDGRAAFLILRALLPPLVLILLVLGSIILGVATVNQAGAIGAAGAMVLAGRRVHDGKRLASLPGVIAVVSVLFIALITTVYDVNLRKMETAESIQGVVLAALAVGFLLFALGWSAWRLFTTDQLLRRAVEETTKTTAMIFAILIGAVMLTAAFRAFGGEVLVRDALENIPGGFFGQFAVVMTVIFLLGFFLDFIEIIVVVIPIVAPIILLDPSANVTALWLGVMFALIIQTSFLTPPFGFALFYLRGVAPRAITTLDIYKGVAPFIALQLIAVVLVFAFPTMVNFLPNRVLLQSEAAPPTTNPRLQYCMEGFVSDEFSKNGDVIRRAIVHARSLDLQSLPNDLRTDFIQGVENAENTFQAMARVDDASRRIAEAATSYRPVHVFVRGLERELRRIDQETSQLVEEISRFRADAEPEVRQGARARLDDLSSQRLNIADQIPIEWQTTQDEFRALQLEEASARRTYRRMADAAYGPVQEIRTLVEDRNRLALLRYRLQEVLALAQSDPRQDAPTRMQELSAEFASVAGTGEIRNLLSRARRALTGDEPDATTASRLLSDAESALGSEIAWRSRASAELLPALEAYDAAIYDTIGLRGQPRLPEHVAGEIASCITKGRDIELAF